MGIIVTHDSGLLKSCLKWRLWYGRLRLFTIGEKSYVLSNHVGNVLATVSDRKLQHNGGSGIVDYYTADVLNATDYAPFGMQLAGRTYWLSTSFIAC